MPGKKLNDFLNESIDSILNNYVVIFKNQNFSNMIIKCILK